MENVRCRQNVFEDLTIQRDVVFGESIDAKGAKQKLGLDICSPQNDNIKNRPVIVWIHSGGLKYGRDKTQSYIVEMASLFAKKGYVGLSIDYWLREHPKDDLTGTITDAAGGTRKRLESQGKRMRWRIQI